MKIKTMLVERLPAAMAIIAAALALSGCYKIGARALGISPPAAERMVTERNLMVPMRDGVRLATDVYRPATPGRYPVVLTRLPYGSDPGDGLPWGYLSVLGKMFVKHGYVYVVQDTRGEFKSEGTWFPFVFEHQDGLDTTAWIKAQPWCDGKIGMWGGSYFGYTQLIAAPDNPDLTAIVPWLASGNLHKLVFRGGASQFMSMRGWVNMEQNAQAKRAGGKGDAKVDISGGFYNEPIRDAQPVDVAATLADPRAMRDGPWKWLSHPGDTENVDALNYTNYYQRVSTPALFIGGWYDIFVNAQFEDFVRLRAEGQGHAKLVHIVIGPWAHGQAFSKMEGKRRYGPKLLGSLMVGWYDYWLKGIDNGAVSAAPVKIFVMGENVWRDEWEWPLARTRYTDYYLHSTGRANPDRGDGGLDATAPADEPPDQYDYDPRNPAPALGGSYLKTLSYRAGPQDQRPAEARADVLVYRSAPLSAPLEITGPITVTLFAASSAADTDWTAKLVDVGPDGFARNLQDGIIRARFRDGLQHPTAIEPGKTYEYRIDLWATSNLFLAGHRIAVEISSSKFPQFDRNTNAAGVGGPDNIVVAHQSILHDRAHPSRITLPVIPR
jgi:uncharacterized protein